jgi:DDE superfamily endonuclease
MTLVRTHFRPEQLVFADESHFNQLTLRRPYVWSIRGERTCRHELFLRGTKYSILPALSLDGIIHLEVLDKAITGDNFRHFVQGLLPCMNEWPLPKSVLVIDNASIHKVACHGSKGPWLEVSVLSFLLFLSTLQRQIVWILRPFTLLGRFNQGLKCNSVQSFLSYQLDKIALVVLLRGGRSGDSRLVPLWSSYPFT